MRLVLDTCVLKLATLPNDLNPAAAIVALAASGHVEAWVSPAMLEEYADVLRDEIELLALVDRCFDVCWPLLTLDVIRHEPDNRFVECALAINADYLVTVNTARGHFDAPAYGRAKVVTPGSFVQIPGVRRWFGLSGSSS